NDGPGFDPQAVDQHDQPHFGLAIMRERAEQVDGRFEIRSSPVGGTEVIVHVPRDLTARERYPAGVRVLLVDDHSLYLEGLRNLLAARGFQVVGAASDGIEAQEQAAALRPDLILMDVQMPRCDGVEATRLIKARHPEIKIVMLTMAAEGEVLFDALKAGASGYLLKSVTGDDFFRLLNNALAGETILSPALASRMLVEFASRAAEPEPDNAPPAL
ncbi:MAG: response regulator, partial [Alphaproteobacteria bacterium]|nr:response regulator [Alphaproteobacteria bacterium]